MKSNKQRSIKATHELIEKFRNPEGKIFFSPNHCPYCKIHNKPTIYGQGCIGCPLANRDGGICCGCEEFTTYKELVLKPNCDSHSEFVKKYIKIFHKIADILESKVLPVLKRTPAKQFTSKGWKYFSELDRSW